VKVALVGLMQSGKSTLLSAISGKGVRAGSGGVVEEVVGVPDERLDWLAEHYERRKPVHATMDCLDLPGLAFGDEHTRAAARRLFEQVRTADMFVIVVKAYGDGANPAKDLTELQTEFLLADLELVTTRIDKLEKQIHKPTKTHAHDKAELALQLKLQEGLEAEKPVKAIIENEHELELVKSLGLLTLKPMMVVANVGESQLGEEFKFDNLDESVEVVSLCAKLESELAQLDAQSQSEFMTDMGITELAVNRFVQSCYATLGLISFLTIGKDEVRAWPIRRDTCALDAAGKVHSDMKRGFIRAETMAFGDLKELGDEKAVKAAGKVRLEGKSYIVQDGDVINFRFNV
jgi:GTP-binding protein YchF